MAERSKAPARRSRGRGEASVRTGFWAPLDIMKAPPRRVPPGTDHLRGQGLKMQYELGRVCPSLRLVIRMQVGDGRLSASRVPGPRPTDALGTLPMGPARVQSFPPRTLLRCGPRPESAYRNAPGRQWTLGPGRSGKSGPGRGPSRCHDGANARSRGPGRGEWSPLSLSATGARRAERLMSAIAAGSSSACPVVIVSGCLPRPGCGVAISLRRRSSGESEPQCPTPLLCTRC